MPCPVILYKGQGIPHSPKSKNCLAPPRMTGFRINARNYFLTYPQCAELPENLLSWLVDQNETLLTCHVVQETHESGDFHLHALLRFEKKKDIRNAAFFDFNGSHPNIQACKNVGKSLSYLKKEGELHSYSANDSDEETAQYADPEDYSSKAAFLRQCLDDNVPYGYAQAFWNCAQKVDKHIYDNTRINGSIIDSELLFREPIPSKTTVVIGDTGVGKTTWALTKAAKPALLCSHVEDLKSITEETQAIIFDDMDFHHWPRSTQIHLVDTDLPRTINVRYGVVHLPAHIQKIFTANSRPFLDDPAINRRIHLIQL